MSNILRVAGTLLPADVQCRRFVAANRYDLAETEYGRALLAAMSDMDRLQEVEVLKSLGDLNVEKGRLHKTEASQNLERGLNLYRAALLRCKDPGQSESIQHRAKIAEKLRPKAPVARSTRDISINSVVRTAEIFQDLDKKSANSILEGYTKLLVKGIVGRDIQLEVEAIKSLGDVNLKRGRDFKESRHLTKATALYNTALERCEDPHGKTVLTHRLLYAAKVRKHIQEVKYRKRQESTKPWERNFYMSSTTSSEAKNGVTNKRFTDRMGVEETSTRQTQEDVNSVYTDQLQEGCRALQTGDLDTADQLQEGCRALQTGDLDTADQLQEGCRALQTGDLDTAERNFAAALKAVHVKEPNTNQYRTEVEPLSRLSDVYLQRGIQSKDGSDFTKAAALRNAALVRARTEDRGTIEHKILQVSQLFVEHVLGIKQTANNSDTERHKLILKKDRKYVEKGMKQIEQEIDPYSLDDDDKKIREVEKQRAEAITTLFQTIVDQRKTFISSLVDECMEVMGPPPCKYAMIGLGSQATGLATPYSDLKFAMLIEEETESNVEYFRNLTHYLHLKVINLGETILPAMAIKSLNDFSKDPPDSWFYDSVTPRGFAFDGAMPHACKTPLGRGKTAELIHTPMSCWALLCGIQPTTIWETIRKMNMNGVIDSENAHHLTVLVSISAEMRLRTYLNNREIQAGVYKSLCEYEKAKSCLKRVLEVKVSKYGTGKAHPGIAKLLNDLGTVCSDLGDHKEAVSYYEQALQMRRCIYGENARHPDIALSLNNLGTALSDLGDHKNAVTCYEHSLQMRQSIYGENAVHLYIAASFNNLGNTWGSLGDYRKAVSYHEQSLKIRRKIHGEETADPDIAMSLNNLGLAWSNLGDHRKAVNYYEQSLRMKRKVHGHETAHPSIVSSLINLGTAWSDLGDPRKAVGYYDQALKMSRKIHGEETAHPDIASSLTNLGVGWDNLGNHRKAVMYGEQSLQMMHSIHGKHTAHPEVATLLKNLGFAWSHRGDHRKAVSYYEESLQMMRKIYGKNKSHADIAVSLNNLGAAWMALSHHRKAVSYFEQSLQMMQSIHGRNTAHPDIILLLNNLGTVWKDLCDHRKAVSYYEQALEMRRRIHGRNTVHPDIVASLDKLGTAWGKLGDHKKAVSYYEQSLQMRQRIHNKNTAHPDIANLLNNLGSAWGALGEYRKAITYFEQSLQMMRRIHGEDTEQPKSLCYLTTWVAPGGLLASTERRSHILGRHYRCSGVPLVRMTNILTL
ncbi:hypothetical protein Bbelb_159730 [Branchiostoma belcheri]|nr:hypothetical protein Bbelb_159730 [Branchiostoma belcheri]